jgi:hypothetical protein
LDEDDNPTQQGMGRTLDVSEGGLLMETHEPIHSPFVLFLSLGLGDDVADVKGRVVYTREGSGGRFESGVEFMEADESQHRIVEKYLKAFREQRLAAE